MFSPEEQQFMNLASKFRDEVSHIDKQIDELTERRNTLMHLLYGESKGEAGMVVEGGEILEVKEEKPKPTAEEIRKNKDSALVRFIKNNPGSSRKDIALHFKSWTDNEIERSIKRCRTAGLIISEGRSRGAVWYLVQS